MKENKKGMVARIVAIALAVVSFVGLAFNFLLGMYKSTVGNMSYQDSTALSFGDWSEALTGESSIDGIGWWKVSKIIMIVALVVVATLAVLAVVRFFVKGKLCVTLTKWVALAGVILSAAFILTFAIGCIVVSGAVSNAVTTFTYLPHVGSCMVGLGMVGASIASMLSAKTKK